MAASHFFQTYKGLAYQWALSSWSTLQQVFTEDSLDDLLSPEERERLREILAATDPTSIMP